VRADLGPNALPTDENDASTGRRGIEVVHEIEEMAVVDAEALTVNREAGNYVLICNIWNEQEQEAHYQEGTGTSFTVE
jgi:hypothetical protein